MSFKADKVERLDVCGRAIEKNLSREFDQFYIEQGLASEQDIAIKNDFSPRST